MQANASNIAVDAIVSLRIDSTSVQNDEEKIYIRLSASLKKAWSAVVEKRKINQTEAGRAMVEWLVRQDELVQLMVFGQASPAEDLIEIVLRRMMHPLPLDETKQDQEIRDRLGTPGSTPKPSPGSGVTIRGGQPNPAPKQPIPPAPRRPPPPK